MAIESVDPIDRNHWNIFTFLDEFEHVKLQMHFQLLPRTNEVFCSFPWKMKSNESKHFMNELFSCRQFSFLSFFFLSSFSFIRFVCFYFYSFDGNSESAKVLFTQQFKCQFVVLSEATNKKKNDWKRNGGNSPMASFN